MSITRSITRPITNRLSRPLTAPGIGGGAPSLTAQVAALFAAKGALGYMIDSINKSNISQNSDGSGAVTTITDPIGRFTDLSGNGNHFTASGTARPYWDGLGAVFDGVNDGMATAAPINMAGVNRFYLLVVEKKSALPADTVATLGLSTSYTANNGSFIFVGNGGGLENFQLGLRTTSTSGAHRTPCTGDAVHSILYKVNLATATSLADQVGSWLDGVAQSAKAGTMAANGTLGNHVGYLGTIGGSPKFANQFRRALLFGSTSFLTTDEENLLLAWGQEGFFP